MALLLPVAAHARITGNTIYLRGLVGRIDGTAIISDHITGDKQEGEALGTELANRLIGQGADVILREIADD